MPRTFWNPTDRPTGVLDVISLSGFENCVQELGQLMAAGTEWIADRKAMYGLRLLGEWVNPLDRASAPPS